MERLTKHEVFEQGGHEKLQVLRGVFSEHGIKTMMFGSRLRGTHIEESDYDVAAIIYIEDGLNDDEIVAKFKEHEINVAKILISVEKDVSKKVFSYAIDDEGKLFTILPKLVEVSDPSVLISVNHGVITRNKPGEIISASKKINKETGGMYRSLVMSLKHSAQKQGIQGAGIYIESIMHALDSVQDMSTEREYLSEMIRIVESDKEIEIPGAEGKTLFKNSEERNTALIFLQRELESYIQ